MMELRTATAYHPHMYDIYLACWVWKKWKLMPNTVVDWMAT